MLIFKALLHTLAGVPLLLQSASLGGAPLAEKSKPLALFTGNFFGELDAHVVQTAPDLAAPVLQLPHEK